MLQFAVCASAWRGDTEDGVSIGTVVWGSVRGATWRCGACTHRCSPYVLLVARQRFRPRPAWASLRHRSKHQSLPWRRPQQRRCQLRGHPRQPERPRCCPTPTTTRLALKNPYPDWALSPWVRWHGTECSSALTLGDQRQAGADAGCFCRIALGWHRRRRLGRGRGRSHGWAAHDRADKAVDGGPQRHGRRVRLRRARPRPRVNAVRRQTCPGTHGASVPRGSCRCRQRTGRLRRTPGSLRWAPSVESVMCVSWDGASAVAMSMQRRRTERAASEKPSSDAASVGRRRRRVCRSRSPVVRKRGRLGEARCTTSHGMGAVAAEARRARLTFCRRRACACPCAHGHGCAWRAPQRARPAPGPPWAPQTSAPPACLRSSEPPAESQSDPDPDHQHSR